MKPSSATFVGLILVLGFYLIAASPQSLGVTFTTEQIINNQIQYSYNAKDDLSYINGVSTGLNFASSVSSSDHIIKVSTGGFVMTNYGYSGAGSSRSFIYQFNLPSGYAVATLQLKYRLTLQAAAIAGNSLSLSISTDGVNYTPLGILVSDGLLHDTGRVLAALPATVIGATTYYVKGTFTFTNYEPNPAYSQFFLSSGVSGESGATFQMTTTVLPSPAIQTIAYWRFENSPFTAPSGFLSDSTGNGNTLSYGSNQPASVSLPDTTTSSLPLGQNFPQHLPGTWRGNFRGAHLSRTFRQYFTLGDNVSLHPSAFTIEALLNLSVSGSNYSTLISHGGGDSTRMGWHLLITSETSGFGARRLVFQFTSDGTSATLETINSGISLQTTHDYYIAFSFNPTTTQTGGAIFYVQDLTAGTALQTIALPHTRTVLYASTLPMTLGVSAPSSAIGWEGLLDEIRFSRGQLPVSKLLISTPPTSSPRVVRGFMTNGNLDVPNDYDSLRKWGATVVRLQILLTNEATRLGETQSIWNVWPQILDKIEAEVTRAKNANMKVVLDLHGDPYFNSSENLTELWDGTKPFAADMCRLWTDIATRMIQKNLTDSIWGYDLYNEPLDRLQYPNSPSQWRGIAIQVLNAIRSVDANTWIIFEVGPGFDFSGFANFAPLPDERVLYSAHFYRPQTFTHQGIITTAYGYTYPSDLNGSGTNWDKSQLEREMAQADQFQAKWNVPIYVGELSTVCWANQTSGTNWLADAIDLLEQRGWSWCYHAYHEFYGWSLEHVDTVPWYVLQASGQTTAPMPVTYETTRAQKVKKGLLNNPGAGTLIMPNSGFEIPNLGTGYQYNPTDSIWTFTNGAGIQANASPWGAAPAPEGTQTAFLQGSGSCAQSFSLPAGTYTLNFQAARRDGQLQPIQVIVDGSPVGVPITPASNSFASYTSATFTVTTGTHSIALTGTDNSGDKTSFVDTVTIRYVSTD